MFWKKKDKGAAGKEPQKSAPAKTSRELILAQAKANAAAARAEIGDETLEKIKAAMLKKQGSPLEQAKAQVKAADQDKVRDHLSLWLEEDRKK